MLLDIAAAVLAQVDPLNPGGMLTPPGAGGFMTLMRWGIWIAVGCCLAGLLYLGGKMGVEHKQGMGGGQATSELWRPFVALLIITNAGAILGAAVTFS